MRPIEEIKADCEASMKKTGMIGPGLYEELLEYIESEQGKVLPNLANKLKVLGEIG